jgi:hypothetical protein
MASLAQPSLGQDTQSLCVALKILEISRHARIHRAQQLADGPAAEPEALILKLDAEPVADDLLAVMAEGRISGVVQQSGAGGYGGRAAAERWVLLKILRQIGRGGSA